MRRYRQSTGPLFLRPAPRRSRRRRPDRPLLFYGWARRPDSTIGLLVHRDAGGRYVRVWTEVRYRSVLEAERDVVARNLTVFGAREAYKRNRRGPRRGRGQP